MSDSENGKTRLKDGVERLVKKPVFNFAKPYFDFIDKGKIFGVFYTVMAVINLLIPFVMLFRAAGANIFRIGGKYAAAFVFVWLAVAFACLVGFQIWHHRRNNLLTIASSEFIVTRIFSELIQTFGEWLGTLIGIIGAGAGLIALIFLGDEARFLLDAIGFGSFNSGALVIIIAPLTGFLIIIFSRFLAEQLRLFASLVNNTKEIAANLKK